MNEDDGRVLQPVARSERVLGDLCAGLIGASSIEATPCNEFMADFPRKEVSKQGVWGVCLASNSEA